MVGNTSSLPNFVIRSLVDQYESKKHLNDQRKKRISSMRKVYSNIERDKIKKYNEKGWLVLVIFKICITEFII